MNRIPEPELMNDPEQAAAYAGADFSDPHNLFIEKFGECFPDNGLMGHVLELGCGPADITMRFARARTDVYIDAVDGSCAMLEHAKRTIAKAGLSSRINLIEGILPGIKPPEDTYETIISNSLLHHLHHPEILWKTVKTFAQKGTIVFIMDLLRPLNEAAAADLVRSYAGEEPKILQRDFYNSLCAAFSLDEVRMQLQDADLEHFQLGQISDRHMIIYGRI